MPETPGALATALAGRYTLERELGAGGMATVYLAQDQKHDRKVAIKVLRPELAAVIGAERFLAEIKTTANLQHPHILPLHDSGAAGSFLYYVMPFVQGESLRDRLDREKQLPVADAVRITTEVAGALHYAHRHGVVHRDIKPENILLHDGSALVADFGIALAASKAGGARMTETGMSLGTPHYMSPEQAMGEREITARSDVYALGAMLYEMLLGEPPFTGPTAQAIVAKVMTEKPAGIVARRDTVPRHLEDAVLTALAKLPADRFASAADFAAALDDERADRRTGGQTPAGRAVSAAPRISRYGWAVAGLAAAAAFALGLAVHRPGPAPVARFELSLPGRASLSFGANTFAISPDGARIAYVASDSTGNDARRRIRVRDRNALEVRTLEGTDGADGPFFSPDGQWIGYTAGSRIWKVAVGGGAPVALADSANTTLSVGAWLPDGSILYNDLRYAVRRIPPAGGTPGIAVPSMLDSANLAQIFPTWMDGNDRILVTTCSNNCGTASVSAVDLATGRQALVGEGAARAWYVKTGHLILARPDGSVSALPYDPRAMEARGPAVPLSPGCRCGAGWSRKSPWRTTGPWPTSRAGPRT